MKNTTYTTKANAVRGFKRKGSPEGFIIIQNENGSFQIVEDLRAKSVVDAVHNVEAVVETKPVELRDYQQEIIKEVKKAATKKVRTGVLIQNDIRNRERPGSIGYACWQAFQKYFDTKNDLPEPDSEFIVNLAKENGWKLITVKTEFYDWKRFNNLLHKKVKDTDAK